MDIIFHYVVGLLISKYFLGEYSFLVIITSMLPDLIGTTYFQIQKVKQCSKKSFKFFFKDFRKYTKKGNFFTNLDKALYRFTHSLVTWILFTLLCLLVFPEIFLILSIAYLSHIIIDILTHNREFSTRLLYPFSDFHIQGFSWATNWKVFIGFWTILIIIFQLY